MCDSSKTHTRLDLEIQLAELDVKILKLERQGLNVLDKMYEAENVGDTELSDQLSSELDAINASIKALTTEGAPLAEQLEQLAMERTLERLQQLRVAVLVGCFGLGPIDDGLAPAPGGADSIRFDDSGVARYDTGEPVY